VKKNGAVHKADICNAGFLSRIVMPEKQSAAQTTAIQKMLLKDFADRFIVTTLIGRSCFFHNQDKWLTGLSIR